MPEQNRGSVEEVRLRRVRLRKVAAGNLYLQSVPFTVVAQFE
ncbi:hypothetical protein [Archangium gephyra]|uniref:Uncharacterized protein n=1 Tax=Archangium gephyra TaxID=48 RepID=A0AAC8TFN3_9BACT|nr:hypothetical protein [Archangium gephyra]AKJ03990.1 Hypothetical protein AA314_05616 [Archangium gephyra]